MKVEVNVGVGSWRTGVGGSGLKVGVGRWNWGLGSLLYFCLGMEVGLNVELKNAFLGLFLLKHRGWVRGWVGVCDPGFIFGLRFR